MVRTKVQRVGSTCERRSYIQTHSRGKEKIPRTLVSYFEQNRQKWMKLRSDYKAGVMMKIACTTNQENQLKSPSIQDNKDAYDKDKKFALNMTCPALELTNIQDGNIGLHLQVLRGGTHPNGVGSELTIFFFARISFLLQLVSFCS